MEPVTHIRCAEVSIIRPLERVKEGHGVVKLRGGQVDNLRASFWAWFDQPILGLVIGAAMIINLVAAALSGIVIPLTLERMKIDPAIASTVFLTTVTDVVGFLAFLGLATLFLL